MLTSYGKGQYAASEQHVGILGRLYKPDGTKRPVIWCHSAGGDATEVVIAGNNTLGHLRAVTDLGLPVISCDLGGIGTWGNDTAQARITDAVSYIRSAFGAHPTLAPILLGVSMGGINLLNWARANPTLVQAIGLFYPVVNLQAMHDGTGGATNAAAGTEAAYGGSLASFNAAVAAHDPAQHSSSYAGVPIKMWHSTADTVVGTANQTAFAAAVGGSAFTAVPVGAAAHADMTKIDATALANFVGAHL